MKSINIIKSHGEKVPFEFDKLVNSLKRSGASEEEAQRIATKITNSLYEGIHTKEIYKNAYQLLKKNERTYAARYHLKNGIMELGPSGFPFEKYFSEILKFEGYQVQTDQAIAGYCVNHEIDIIAEKDNCHFLVECKYHSKAGYKCNVKTPLYIHSRFRDIEKQRLKKSINESKMHQAWIVTNTQFSRDAIQYGKCSGMYLISWSYPKSKSLKDRIDVAGLYPVTCLTTLTGREKRVLLDQMIVLCQDICKDDIVLKRIGISDSRINKISKEAKALCFGTIT